MFYRNSRILYILTSPYSISAARVWEVNMMYILWESSGYQFSDTMDNHELRNVHSRRGITSLPEICIMISHPDYIHIPLPPDPDPHSSSASKKPRTKKTKAEKLNILHSTVIPLLMQRGLLAESLTSDHKTWEGIVRLPGPLGAWGNTLDRISAIEKVEGVFRKISI